ncbi:DUF6525 family protein [Ruegeria sp. 6PALISEP08]|uniref:DUF6525 family protein n=1 Tax=Ruegeria sp. 6PALISEP08 TaxID=1225660 RepID=UPI0021101890|nr:DUF6525 family protein [Ruegeria sp. 6PALISEP08]
MQRQADQGRRYGKNLRTGLKRRRRQLPPMKMYDSLPPRLRQWLASARLPWCPASARKIWNRAGGARNPTAAVMRLNEIERAMLRRDAGVWSAKSWTEHSQRPAEP